MLKFIENNPILRFIAVFVTTIIFVGIFLVILFPTFGILLVWRWIIALAAKWFQKGKLGKMVTATSTIFASANVFTRKAVTMVVAVQVDSPTIDLDNFRTQVKNRLLDARKPNTNELLYPELKSTLRPWMGYLFWAPCKTFDIKNHIMSIQDTEAPTTDPEDPTFLPRITTYFTRDRIWDRKKPHWEFIVAENVQLPHSESSPKSFLILRAHHALGDGWSFFKATSKFLENPNILNNVKLPQFMGQSRSVGVCSRLWNSFWFWIKLPFETVENFLTVMPDRTEIPTFKVPPQCESSDVFGVMEEIWALDRLKRLKNRLGVDFHSLIVAGIASAIRQIYQDLGMKVPERIKFTYPLPMPGHPEKLRNHMSVGFIPLPIGESDPVKRLQLISTRVQSGIRAGLPLPFFLILRLMGSMPLFFVHKLRTNLKVSPVIFTNIVGPSTPFYFEDKLISDVKFSTNIPYDGPGGYAFGIGIFTYCGRTNFGVAGLRDYFPDISHPQKFIERCVAEWEGLEKIIEEDDDDNTSLSKIV